MLSSWTYECVHVNTLPCDLNIMGKSLNFNSSFNIRSILFLVKDEGYVRSQEVKDSYVIFDQMTNPISYDKYFKYKSQSWYMWFDDSSTLMFLIKFLWGQLRSKHWHVVPPLSYWHGKKILFHLLYRFLFRSFGSSNPILTFIDCLNQKLNCTEGKSKANGTKPDKEHGVEVTASWLLQRMYSWVTSEKCW